MRRSLFLLPLLALPFAFSFAADPAPKEEKKDAAAVDFDKEIKPLLEAKCAKCHGEKKKDAGFDARTPASMLKGGISGPAYVPGDSGKSMMIDMIRFKEMPPKSNKDLRFTAEELAKLKTWVDQQKK